MISFSSFIDESLGQPKGLLDRLRAVRNTKVDPNPFLMANYSDLSWNEIDSLVKKYVMTANEKKRLVEELLIDRGFSLLGQGVYASVWGHPGYSYVVKTFVEDAGYKKWLKYCQQNAGNVCVPKIRGQLLNARGIHLVRLEKLSPMTYAEYDEFDSHIKHVYAHPESDPEMYKAIKWIEDNGTFDGHAGNVMFRPSTHDYVITDPLCD